MTALLGIDANLTDSGIAGFSSPYVTRYESVSLPADGPPGPLKLQMIAPQKGTTKLYISFQDCTANDTLFSAIWANATAADPEYLVKAKRVWIDHAANRRVERLISMQSAFGVSTQLFAQMLGISRAQLYKWLDSNRAIELQPASTKRIATLERLAISWVAISAAPINSVLDEATDGVTLRELMTMEVIDEARVETALHTLAQTLTTQPQTLSQRMASAGFKSRRASRLPDDE